MGLLGFSRPARAVCRRLRDRLQRVVLADDALARGSRERQNGRDLVLDHAADGDAGPVGDDRGDGLLIDARAARAGVRPEPVGELRLQRLAARSQQSVASSVPALAPAAAAVDRPCRPRAACARNAENLVDQCLLLLPGGLQRLRAARSRLCNALVTVLLALGRIDTDRRFAADDLQLGLQRLDAALAVLHLQRESRDG